MDRRPKLVGVTQRSHRARFTDGYKRGNAKQALEMKDKLREDLANAPKIVRVFVLYDLRSHFRHRDEELSIGSVLLLN